MDTYREFSGYRCMWLMVMFDLPTETKKQKDSYRRFREGLIDDGFIQIQYSVYLRFCSTDEVLNTHKKRVINALPSEWQVRLLFFTDKQFERMQVFYGQALTPTEPVPTQISMF